MKRVLLAMALAAAVMPARAGDSILLANSLGDVLGSEEGCGLAYDQPAIEAFISAKVAADDMDFIGQLQTFSRGARRNFEKLTASERTAQCAQVRRVAKSFGFVK